MNSVQWHCLHKGKTVGGVVHFNGCGGLSVEQAKCLSVGQV